MKFEEEDHEFEADDEPQLGSPAFQFYPGDYLSSSKVMRMSLEAEGAYIRLLAYCWLDGYVPNDMDQIAILCKTSRCRLKKIWPQTSACFVEKRSGKLINLRLEKEREKQARHREAKSFAGKKGASVRWKLKSTITVSERMEREAAVALERSIFGNLFSVVPSSGSGNSNSVN